jgi:hypothetical protein
MIGGGLQQEIVNCLYLNSNEGKSCFFCGRETDFKKQNKISELFLAEKNADWAGT